MNITDSIEIAAAPERVWDNLIDPEMLPLWMKGLESVEQTEEGPRGVGSTAVLKIREGGKLAEYRSRLTAFEPPKHIALVLTGETFNGMQMHVDYTLTDLVNVTRLDYLCRPKCKGVFMRLMIFLFGGLARKQLAGMMKTLKRLAEEPS